MSFSAAPLPPPPGMLLQATRASSSPYFLKFAPSRFLPPIFNHLVCKSGGLCSEFRRSGASWMNLAAVREEGVLEDLPVSVSLAPICSEAQFDKVVAEAQQAGELVIIVWMASWCRKCIYLKPKLEKLAADYYPRLRFHCVDVNAVPHKLVSRAGVTKMPTIQLWKDCKKQAEVIGGHKAHFVVNEVREMIENELTTC